MRKKIEAIEKRNRNARKELIGGKLTLWAAQIDGVDWRWGI